VGFSEEGDGEHAVFDADAHEFGGVAFDGGEFDAMAFDPFSVFGVGGDLDCMAIVL
jgi:hypothetical protein